MNTFLAGENLCLSLISYSCPIKAKSSIKRVNARKMAAKQPNDLTDLRKCSNLLT